ncbi:hypothetical protein DFO70_1306 [Cytobacillus firmus]|uniref:Uncharacterized protein n=2 Tax=Cytobacillus TaxID=2675230 RepID=A0A366JI68_CYTFI|nr:MULTISPECIES: hypothetical protein [Cytobacillus]RBP86200.1 hypothetical protein DFO70_1306 [Cytobacillus firmus]TDX45539.1 hypothetical protein DFO72_1027 [Cytobacillus oceanisediminis]
MKKIEVLLSVLLIVTGLVCLTMSGTMMIRQDITAYFKTFLQTCAWMGVPIILAGIVYLIIVKKRG